MPITLSHRLFIEHRQYYTGCSWPTVVGVGSTPHDALDDAMWGIFADLPESHAARTALKDYPNTEPDEPGELADIPGWDQDGSEVSWHCELTIEGLEEPS